MQNRFPIWPVVVVCAIAVIVVAMIARACTSTPKDTSIVRETATAAAIIQTSGQLHATMAPQTYQLDPADFLEIPESSSVIGISLGEDPAPALSASELSDVSAAIADIEEIANCSFVFVDVNTGRGIAYNAASELYVASASKAPLVLYAMSCGAGANEQDREAIQDIIVYSDNDAFEYLASLYLTTDYFAWLTNFDVHHDNLDDFYPRMNARSLACIWATILAYVRDGSADALWIADLMTQTETSFIRDALHGENAVVMNKGGWITDYDTADYDEGEGEGGESEGGVVIGDMDGINSVTDAGIVEADRHVYIMAVLSEQPDGGDAESNVIALARALYDVHAKL